MSCRRAASQEALEATRSRLDALSLTQERSIVANPRLLLMAGILVADELFELRKASGAPDLSLLAALATQAEAMADAAESRGGDTAHP